MDDHQLLQQLLFTFSPNITSAAVSLKKIFTFKVENVGFLHTSLESAFLIYLSISYLIIVSKTESTSKIIFCMTAVKQ